MPDLRSPGRHDPHARDAAAWDAPATLPGRDYCSPEVFEIERGRLFHGSWFCVGRADEAPDPGSFAVFDVAGESVIVVRGEDGALRGFLNVCRHRGSRLCDGSGSVKAIRCPYHAWSYGLDGRLLSTPNVRRGERLPRERLGLHEMPLEVWEGFVWVSVAGSGGELAGHLERWASDDPFQWARYAVGSLVVGARREYDVAANWKILIENYNECLHCPTVHPELTKLVPVYRRGEVEEEPAQNGNGNQLADGFTSFTKRGRSGLPPLPGLDPADHGTFYGVTLLPNLIVNYHSDTVSTFLLLPERADRTRVVCHYLFAREVAEAAGFDPSEVVDFRHTLARQDWTVCERAQRGATSRGYAGGGVLPYADRFVHSFHQQYRALLAGDLERPAEG
jgi:phenylpropionate dioxygenase-like ring-hydroxylating dioxygenase large terminal subunit